MAEAGLVELERVQVGDRRRHSFTTNRFRRHSRWRSRSITRSKCPRSTSNGAALEHDAGEPSPSLLRVADPALERPRSDGTPSGTTFVAPGQSTSLPAPSPPVAFGSAVYFPSGGLGSELWRTDGTAAGTGPFVDLHPTAGSAPAALTVGGSTMYFTAATPTHGRELWRTDGTPAGTQLVKDIGPGASGADPRDLVALDTGVALFAAWAPNVGFELWRSDGSAPGTTLVWNALPGTSSGYEGGLVSLGDEAWFFTHDASFQPMRLCRTDGTAAGTAPFANAQWVDQANLLPTRAGSGKLVLFRGEHHSAPQVGVEPFVSDGSAAGTHLLVDVQPGGGSSWPYRFTRAGGRIFFAADDGVHGMELHAVALSDLGGWVAEKHGTGCGISSPLPTLDLSGETVAGMAATLGLRDAAPSAVAHLYVAALELGTGCTFYLDNPIFLFAAATSVTGDLAVPLTIPVTPSLLGIPLFLQAGALVPGGPMFGAAELSNALGLVIGA